MLIQAGADKEAQGVLGVQDGDGRTPLYVAAMFLLIGCERRMELLDVTYRSSLDLIAKWLFVLSGR